jgi:hypothetical protein
VLSVSFCDDIQAGIQTYHDDGTRFTRPRGTKEPTYLQHGIHVSNKSVQLDFSTFPGSSHGVNIATAKVMQSNIYSKNSKVYIAVY